MEFLMKIKRKPSKYIFEIFGGKSNRVSWSKLLRVQILLEHLYQRLLVMKRKCVRIKYKCKDKCKDTEKEVIERE